MVFGLHSFTLNSCFARDSFILIYPKYLLPPHPEDLFIVSEMYVFHFPGLSWKEEWSGLLNMKKENYYRQGWIETSKRMHFFMHLIRISLK